MSENDSLRKKLREADPALGAELPAADRIAMRQAVVRAAAQARPPARRVWILAAATACAMALVVAAAWMLSGRRGEPVSPPTAAHAPEAPHTEVAATAIAPSPSPRVAAVHAIRTRQRAIEPVPAARTEGTTRIQFVAPEGTRVFWFPNTPNASEVGS